MADNLSGWSSLLLSGLAGGCTIFGGFIALGFADVDAVSFSGLLAFAAGVMTLVSFVEVYPEGLQQLTSGLTHLHEQTHSTTTTSAGTHSHGEESATHMHAYGDTLALTLLLTGWFFASFMDAALHTWFEDDQNCSGGVDGGSCKKHTNRNSSAGVNEMVERTEEDRVGFDLSPVPSLATRRKGSSSSFLADNRTVPGSPLVEASVHHEDLSRELDSCTPSRCPGDPNTISTHTHKFRHTHFLLDCEFVKSLRGLVEDVTAEEIRCSEKKLKRNLKGIKRIGVLSTVVLALHNIPEGVATFVTASASRKVGLSMAVAIGLHNIPEGLTVAILVYHGTGSRTQALLMTAASGLAEPLGACAAWLLLSTLDRGPESLDLPLGALLLITAGIMLNISIKVLFANAVRYDPANKLATSAFFGGMIFMAFSLSLLHACVDLT